VHVAYGLASQERNVGLIAVQKVTDRSTWTLDSGWSSTGTWNCVVPKMLQQNLQSTAACLRLHTCPALT